MLCYKVKFIYHILHEIEDDYLTCENSKAEKKYFVQNQHVSSFVFFDSICEEVCIKFA